MPVSTLSCLFFKKPIFVSKINSFGYIFCIFRERCYIVFNVFLAMRVLRFVPDVICGE